MYAYIYYTDIKIILQISTTRQRPPEASRDLQKPPEISRGLHRPPKTPRYLQRHPDTPRDLQHQYRISSVSLHYVIIFSH